GKAAFEIKYDGMRIQIHKEGGKITIFTRRLDDVTKQFPEIVDYAKKCITAKNCLIEGEVVGINPQTGRPYPFQKLSRRIKRKYDIEEMAKKIPVEVNLFDIMYLEGETLIGVPFSERRKELEKIIKPVKGKFQLAEQVVTGDVKEAEKLFKKAIGMGHEGVMVKNLGAAYTPGSRVKHMYKVKPVQESLDLVIIGAIWGEGRRSKWLGSYILGAKDPETEEFIEVGKVATGLTDENLQTLTDMLKPLITREHVNRVEIKPKLVVEVGYEEIQKSPTYESGFALRFPRVVNIREDKGPEDATTTEQIAKLFGSQRHKK
ncbi:MAG: ATP-dependent DNA ligase, partial [Candidatus Eisenbacteria sp.]|nr:ATP-dependent DNA ligase [Candidatus Eisenbacteria bacterium]